MKDRLRNLLALQQLDAEVIAIKRRLSRLPEELKHKVEELDNKKTSLKTSEAKLNSTRLDYKEIELEISALNSSITRNNEKQIELKSMRDHQAMKNQIASLKADLKHNEDVALQLMQQMETQETEVSKILADIAVLEDTIASLKTRSDDEVAAVRERIDELKKNREPLVHALDPLDYDAYRRLMRPPNYVALAAVKTATGLCSACHVTIEPQTMNRLYIGKEMIACSNCQRILYLPETLD